MPEDTGIEPRTVATTALAVRRSNHSARFHPQSARSHPVNMVALRKHISRAQIFSVNGLVSDNMRFKKKCKKRRNSGFPSTCVLSRNKWEFELPLHMCYFSEKNWDFKSSFPSICIIPQWVQVSWGLRKQVCLG
jgi:hypothetical protein